VTGPSNVLPIDAGLLARFRHAGERIEWGTLPGGRARSPGASARLARLNDEEARIEEVPGPAGGSLRAESGPVGALVILLEADRRGTLPELESWDSGRSPAFPSGAIVAHWEPTAAVRTTAEPPRISDLVELARYALV
jgi:hypothetical protein